MARLEFTAVAGCGRLRVTARAFRTPDGGVTLHLLGGELPHLGAVAMAAPRPSLTGQGVSSTVSVFTFLGHKDDEVARPAAAKIAAALNAPAVVVAGIHVDDAGPDDVLALAANARRAVDMALKALKGRRPA